jgi:hypothetical protein
LLLSVSVVLAMRGLQVTLASVQATCQASPIRLNRAREAVGSTRLRARLDSRVPRPAALGPQIA